MSLDLLTTDGDAEAQARNDTIKEVGSSCIKHSDFCVSHNAICSTHKILHNFCFQFFKGRLLVLKMRNRGENKLHHGELESRKFALKWTLTQFCQSLAMKLNLH